MPTVTVGRDALMAALGETYDDKSFEDLCFEFGVELDDITSEAVVMRKEKTSEKVETEALEVVYKIDISANRYDLLCLEGLALALNVFRKKIETPNFRSIRPPPGQEHVIRVSPQTAQIRPYVVGCVLKGLKFDSRRYNSFIDLQDKLHENICRRRTLVAIGTHDLDTISGPFTYEALPPTDIVFAPLNQEKTMNGAELMEFYEKDQKLKAYLHIIRNSPVYPVIYDSKRTVLSLPPIINGDHSKISMETKNVFIECTATDPMRAKIVLDTMVSMFSGYCEEPFTCEDVKVIYPDGNEQWYPDLKPHVVTAGVDYINRIGESPAPPSPCALTWNVSWRGSGGREADRASWSHADQGEAVESASVKADVLKAELDKSNNSLNCVIPPTRHDVLQ
eukprot:746616-Hanusia_phi.AAC.1